MDHTIKENQGLRRSNIITFFLLLIAASRGRNDPALQQAKLESEQQRQKEAADLEIEMSKLLSIGSIHSVSVARREVRIDPLIWRPMTVEAKQRILYSFTRYFALKMDARAEAKILSNRDDTVFAEYNEYSGFQIHY